MTLFELHADMEQLTFQMKRIADVLERLIPPAVIHTPSGTKAELHQVSRGAGGRQRRKIAGGDQLVMKWQR